MASAMTDTAKSGPDTEPDADLDAVVRELLELEQEREDTDDLTRKVDINDRMQVLRQRAARLREGDI